MKVLFYPQNPMLDDMMYQFFGDAFGNTKTNSKYPLTNVYEENGIAYMEVAVAGFTKDEIKIKVENNTLTITGTTNKLNKSERKYIKKDIAMRNFDKSYNLMFPIETVDATFNNGILTIKLIPIIQKIFVSEIEIK